MMRRMGMGEVGALKQAPATQARGCQLDDGIGGGGGGGEGEGTKNSRRRRHCHRHHTKTKLMA